MITASPVSIPPTGPNCSAAEIVGLVAHNVVGQVWFSEAHCVVATTLFDHMSKTTIRISAITHAGRRPNPRQYCRAQAALHRISTPKSTHPGPGSCSWELIAIWKYIAYSHLSSRKTGAARQRGAVGSGPRVAP